MLGQLCYCLQHNTLFDEHTAFPSNSPLLLDTLSA
jgi:hypothetical protein